MGIPIGRREFMRRGLIAILSFLSGKAFLDALKTLGENGYTALIQYADAHPELADKVAELIKLDQKYFTNGKMGLRANNFTSQDLSQALKTNDAITERDKGPNESGIVLRGNSQLRLRYDVSVNDIRSSDLYPTTTALGFKFMTCPDQKIAGPMFRVTFYGIDMIARVFEGEMFGAEGQAMQKGKTWQLTHDSNAGWIPVPGSERVIDTVQPAFVYAYERDGYWQTDLSHIEIALFPGVYMPNLSDLSSFASLQTSELTLCPLQFDKQSRTAIDPVNGPGEFSPGYIDKRLL